MPTLSWASFRLADFPSVTGPLVPITAASVGWFLYALTWAVILLVSFTGWGRSVARLLRVGQLPASVACSLGIAVVIFLGGILNLLHALSVPVLLALVVIGLVLYLWLRGNRPEAYRWRTFWRQMPAGARLVLVAALIILALRVAATVHLSAFNNLDDGPAYLVFPHKLLASHHFAFDPFSDRRVISSVGGAYLLQAMVIAATSLAHIGMADRTLGLILLAVALFDLGIAFELSAWQIAILEFLAYLVPQPAINLTFIVLPTSLLIAMVWFILRTDPAENRAHLRYAWMAGMVGGAVVSLKSTFLPCVGAFILIPYLLLPSAGKRRNHALWLLLAFAGALFVLALWMIAMRANSGTFLFPIFGTGVDYASYGRLSETVKFASTRSVVKVFLQAIPLLLLAAIQFASGARTRRARLSGSILIASAIAIVAFNYKSGADFIWRYNFPQFFVAILVFYAAAAGQFHRKPATGWIRAVFGCGLAALAAMTLYYDAGGKRPRPFRTIEFDQRDYRSGLRASLSGRPLSSPEIVREYAAVEASLPPNSQTIENTAYPFLFHYQNHTVYVMDWPGAASPAPGWPFGRDAEETAQYLKSHGVRFVIYGYRYGRWVDMEGCEALEKANLNSQELLALWRMTVVTHNQLDHLHARYRSVYDDGKIAVIDLDQPLADRPAAEPLWTLETSTDVMCSTVMRRYLADPEPLLPK